MKNKESPARASAPGRARFFSHSNGALVRFLCQVAGCPAVRELRSLSLCQGLPCLFHVFADPLFGLRTALHRRPRIPTQDVFEGLSELIGLIFQPARFGNPMADHGGAPPEIRSGLPAASRLPRNSTALPVSAAGRGRAGAAGASEVGCSRGGPGSPISFRSFGIFPLISRSASRGERIRGYLS